MGLIVRHIRVKLDVSDRLHVSVTLRHECVMSPWLINVYMDYVDHVVRKGNNTLFVKGLILMGVRKW